MTAIWKRDTGRWRPLAAGDFPDERTLHGLVEETPELLPLAASPKLVIVGREVQLGAGYADLLAVEPDGRLALIEIKGRSLEEAQRIPGEQIMSPRIALRFMRATTTG